MNIASIAHTLPRPLPGSDAQRPGGAVAAYDAVRDVLDLSSARGIPGEGLTEEEQADFLDMLATLLKHGIVGTETREVDGEERTSFVSISFADPEFRSAPPARKRLDILA